MEKRLLTILFLFIVATFNTSCETNEDVIWDFTNYNILFSFEDPDLLEDPNFLSKVKVTLDGEVYTYSENDFYTRANMPMPFAIRILKYSDTERVLAFGEFSPENPAEVRNFTIDWGNGRVDDVEVTLYIKWKKGEPDVCKGLKINGENVSFGEAIKIQF